MKNVFNAVFGKLIIAGMLVTGLAACNTNQRSEEIRVRERGDGSKEVKTEQRIENDSVSIDRERTIRTDEDGYGDTKVRDNTKVDLERDRDDDNDNR
jgi:hypothetical protein